MRCNDELELNENEWDGMKVNRIANKLNEREWNGREWNAMKLNWIKWNYMEPDSMGWMIKMNWNDEMRLNRIEWRGMKMYKME